MTHIEILILRKVGLEREGKAKALKIYIHLCDALYIV